MAYNHKIKRGGKIMGKTTKNYEISRLRIDVK